MGKSEHLLETNDEWCTPALLYDPLVWGWGGIDIDPFGNFRSSVPAAERWVRQETWDAASPTLSDEKWNALIERGYVVGDARTNVWEGRILANGPYTNCAWWLSRAADAADERGAHVVCIVPARLNNGWWDTYVWQRASAVCWPRKRVNFEGLLASGKKGVNAPFHVGLPYYGSEPYVFGMVYEHVGHIQILRPQTIPLRQVALPAEVTP